MVMTVYSRTIILWIHYCFRVVMQIIQTRSLRIISKSEKGLQRWESDYLLIPGEGLFYEYLEMGEVINKQSQSRTVTKLPRNKIPPSYSSKVTDIDSHKFPQSLSHSIREPDCSADFLVKQEIMMQCLAYYCQSMFVDCFATMAIYSSWGRSMWVCRLLISPICAQTVLRQCGQRWWQKMEGC